MVEGAILENQKGIIVRRLEDHNSVAIGKPGTYFEESSIFFFKEIKDLLICFEQTCPRAFCGSPRSCAGTPPAFGKIATTMTMVGEKQF